MTKLSVNVNKIATIRNSRGENSPDVLAMALLIEELGADGITVHPRPDGRHIRKSDVIMLKNHLHTELNVEGFPSDDFIDFMHAVRPQQITLVPDPPQVLTSNAGFALTEDFAFVSDAIKRLKPTKARISIFIDPKDFLGRDRDARVIKETGADRIELYTKKYAEYPYDSAILESYRHLAQLARDMGLGINAGHDLSSKNLGAFLAAIPFIDEVSIGHAIVCDALVFGMKETIKRYLSIAHGLPSH